MSQVNYLRLGSAPLLKFISVPISGPIGMSFSLSSTTVLGKRKATRYILHISASPQPEPSTLTAHLAVHDTPEPFSKKARHPCTYSGCTKSYSKACRLAEHIRSHTGEVTWSGVPFYAHCTNQLKQRPYVCTTCQKSYLRESHLQAHAKSHLPESERPYVCTESTTCQKRFWTLQHLQVHENTHSGAKSYTVCDISTIQAIHTNFTFSVHGRGLRRGICQAPSAAISYLPSTRTPRYKTLHVHTPRVCQIVRYESKA
jgi:uncharacterized Zn-finger protein